MFLCNLFSMLSTGRDFLFSFCQFWKAWSSAPTCKHLFFSWHVYTPQQMCRNWQKLLQKKKMANWNKDTVSPSAAKEAFSSLPPYILKVFSVCSCCQRMLICKKMLKPNAVTCIVFFFFSQLQFLAKVFKGPIVWPFIFMLYIFPNLDYFYL